MIAATALLLAVTATIPRPQPSPKVWAVANAVLAVADYERSLHVQQLHAVTVYCRSGQVCGHAWEPKCYESDRLLFGVHPNRTTFYLRGFALDAAVEGGGWLLARKVKRLRKFRAVGFATVSYWHASGFASSFTCP